MSEGFLCEVNPYEKVWSELVLHISRNRRKRRLNFWYIINPGVFQSTSNALICMPEGFLREINQY